MPRTNNITIPKAYAANPNIRVSSFYFGYPTSYNSSFMETGVFLPLSGSYGLPYQNTQSYISGSLFDMSPFSLRNLYYPVQTASSMNYVYSGGFGMKPYGATYTMKNYRLIDSTIINNFEYWDSPYNHGWVQMEPPYPVYGNYMASTIVPPIVAPGDALPAMGLMPLLTPALMVPIT